MEQDCGERILFLFRHGETDWNREGRLQGHSDTPLNATGLAQARALSVTLRPHRLDAVISSDLVRAWTTAQIVAEALDIPLISEPGLREAQIGAAEGLLWAEAKTRFGEELSRRWYIDDYTAFPGGETGVALRMRGLAALRRFAAAHTYQRVGVSTHAALLRQLMRHALPPGSPPAAASNTVLHVLRYEPAADRLIVVEREELANTAGRP